MNEQSLKDRLKSIAVSENRTFNEVWRKLLLERFLVRLSKSEYNDKFIFKGGLLLSHYLNIGRETKDADFLIAGLNTEIPNIEKAFHGICGVKINDEFLFSFANIAELEQPHMNYPGLRVNVDIKFGEKMRDRIQIDIGIGDVVSPDMESLELYKYRGKPFYEGSLSLRVYPVEAIFSEKLETIISKGSTNSRMKDYHDLLLLCREKELLNPEKLRENIAMTFSNRKTEVIIPIVFTDEDYALLQKLWTSHRRGLGTIAAKINLPTDIKNLVSELNNWLVLNKII
jgi:predicted nucleotidyltransferase component of viral defense system